jgi:type I restriction enzyme, S subunit
MSNQSDILSAPIFLPEAIPNNWEWNLLTEHTEPKQWATISSSQLQKNGYPVYGANGLIGYYSEYNHEHETIAITCRGATCGTVNLIPSKSYVTGNAMCLDSLNDETIALKYLYYALSFRHLSDVISGSAQPQITREGLSNVLFPLPPLPEQQKIASILTSVVTVIEKTEAQINKLKDLKKAMMQELLTKGIGHTEFKDSPVGRIPKGWEVKKLIEICKVRQGLQIPISDRFKSDGKDRYIYLTVSLVNSGFEERRKEYIQSPKKNVTLGDGEILLARTGAVGKVIHGIKCVFHNNFFAINFEHRTIDKGFFIQYLTSEDTQTMIRKLAGTTTIPDLNHGDFYSLLIGIPPLSEQQEITFILISIDKHIKENELKNSHTKSLKKALMQDLLTGKVRVAV